MDYFQWEKEWLLLGDDYPGEVVNILSLVAPKESP